MSFRADARNLSLGYEFKKRQTEPLPEKGHLSRREKQPSCSLRSKEGKTGSWNMRLADRKASILARGIPRAKFVVHADQKHNYFASAPDEVHRVIREFLDNS
jgi:hypothetical protein